MIEQNGQSVDGQNLQSAGPSGPPAGARDGTGKGTCPPPPLKKPGPFGAFARIMGNVAFAALLLLMLFLVFTLVQSRLSGGPPSLFGYQLYIVKGGSMSPAFEAGSLAFLKPVAPADVGVGDIVTYRPAGGGETLTTHRVVAVNEEGGGLRFITRGDANRVDDPLPVYPENIVGRVVYALPYAGYLLDFGQTKTGIVFLVFIPGALVIVFELRYLFRLAAQWEAEKARKQNAGSKSVSEEA